MDQRRRRNENRHLDGRGDLGQGRKPEKGRSKGVADKTRRGGRVSDESSQAGCGSLKMAAGRRRPNCVRALAR